MPEVTLRLPEPSKRAVEDLRAAAAHHHAERPFGRRWIVPLKVVAPPLLALKTRVAAAVVLLLMMLPPLPSV